LILANANLTVNDGLRVEDQAAKLDAGKSGILNYVDEMTEMKFPVYRKYINRETYFKIESLESFEEIRSLGTKWIIETHPVKILPDRNFVHDLLNSYSDFAEEITGEVYREMREKAVKGGR